MIEARGMDAGVPWVRRTQVDYGLLFRRVLAQLEIVNDGATVKLGRTGGPSTVEHPSRLLEGPQAPHVWLKRRWQREKTWHGKREVLVLALEELKLARVRVKAKLDLDTQDGRLAVGREALLTSVEKVAAHYGYSKQHVYKLRAAALAEAQRQDLLREHRRIGDYSLSERSMIAADPRSSYAVAAEFGLHASTVQRWKVRYSPLSAES